MDLTREELIEIYKQTTEKIIDKVVDNKIVTELINSEFNNICKQLIIEKLLEKPSAKIITVENVNKLLNEVNMLKNKH